MKGGPDGDIDPRAVEVEAMSWVLRLYAADMSDADTDEMLRWRAQHPAHAVALSNAVKLRRRIAGAWDAMDREDAARAAVPPLRRAPPRIGRRAFMGGALAASVGAVALVRPPLGLWPSLAELRSDYRTGTGERRTVEVAQGIKIELNTRTSVARRPDAKALRLELVEGEIAVDAAHRSLAVAIQTGAGEVIAERARFGVRLVEAGTCVTCMAGDVLIRDRQQRAATIAAGEQLTFDGETRPTARRVDVESAEAWRRGLLVFYDEPLGNVVREINRYRPGRIVLTNEKLAALPISGTFQVARLDRAVAQLKLVSRAEATNLPGGIVLLG